MLYVHVHTNQMALLWRCNIRAIHLQKFDLFIFPSGNEIALLPGVGKGFENSFFAYAANSYIVTLPYYLMRRRSSYFTEKKITTIYDTETTIIYDNLYIPSGQFKLFSYNIPSDIFCIRHLK